MNLRTSHRISRTHQGGFILTIELLLITTVLIIGSFVGIVAIRDALFTQAQLKQSRSAFVIDSNGTRLGAAVDYDEHDAPRIPYIDRSVSPLAPDPNHRNYRVLLSVRDDRFTSREPLYYSGENCTGTPCIKTTSDEISDNVGPDGVSGSGSVSYLNALQGGPNYAVGISPDRIKGHLFRETSEACPVAVEEIRSRYISKKVVAGTPCESFNIENNVPASTECLINALQDCSCPAGSTSQGEILENYLGPIDSLLNETLGTLSLLVPILPSGIDIGTLCCPVGTVLEDDNNLINAVVYTALSSVIEQLSLGPIVEGLVKEILDPLYGEPRCISAVTLRNAQEVLSPNDPSQNALAPFTAPFSVNLPSDINAQDAVYSASGFIFVAPDKEG